MIERVRRVAGKVWPHVVAAFLAFHLLAIFLQALPAPGGGMNKANWKAETVQAEFRAWSARLNALGLQQTPKELEEGTWTFASRFMEARTDVLKPFAWYYKPTGTWQSWRMFVAPHTRPSKLRIRVKEHGTWRSIYEERSNEFTWRRTMFDHDRMRSAVFRYSWPGYGKQWKQFCTWIFEEARRDFPEADEIDAAFWEADSPSPEEVRAGVEPEGKWIRRRSWKQAK